MLPLLESSWNVMAHGDAREGKWRGNWRMECVSSTLYTTSELGVSSITTADAHTSAASSRLNWRPLPIWMDSSVSQKDEIWFLRACHHISNAVYHGKAISVTYSVYVTVASVVQHATRMRHIVICGPSGSTLFFKIVSQTLRFFWGGGENCWT